MAKIEVIVKLVEELLKEHATQDQEWKDHVNKQLEQISEDLDKIKQSIIG
tara:strand:+ start:127 stop:276 length:150 start_codon:yes stop_codon:yes gene_type:complete